MKFFLQKDEENSKNRINSTNSKKFIPFFLLFRLLVTRSRTFPLRQHNMNPWRQLIVQIEPNLPAIALAWLNQVAPPVRPEPMAPNPPNAPIQPMVSNFASVSSIPPIAHALAHRRASIASCSNIFSVDGYAEELGFDHLPRNRPIDPNSEENLAVPDSDLVNLVDTVFATPNNANDDENGEKDALSYSSATVAAVESADSIVMIANSNDRNESNEFDIPNVNHIHTFDTGKL